MESNSCEVGSVSLSLCLVVVFGLGLIVILPPFLLLPVHFGVITMQGVLSHKIFDGTFPRGLNGEKTCLLNREPTVLVSASWHQET